MPRYFTQAHRRHRQEDGRRKKGTAAARDGGTAGRHAAAAGGCNGSRGRQGQARRVSFVVFRGADAEVRLVTSCAT